MIFRRIGSSRNTSTRSRRNRRISNAKSARFRPIEPAVPMDISPTLSLSPTISSRTNDLFDLLDEGTHAQTQRRENSARYGRRAIPNIKNQTLHNVPDEIIPYQKTTNKVTEDFLEQSWTSLNVFNRKQKGRLTSKRQGKPCY